MIRAPHRALAIVALMSAFGIASFVIAGKTMPLISGTKKPAEYMHPDDFTRIEVGCEALALLVDGRPWFSGRVIAITVDGQFVKIKRGWSSDWISVSNVRRVSS